LVARRTRDRGAARGEFISEIAGIQRFTSDAQLAQLAGCAPIPVTSGQSDRYRLDPGGNRRLNSSFYMLAIIRIRTDPRTAVYLKTAGERQDQKGKRSAASNATSSPRRGRTAKLVGDC